MSVLCSPFKLSCEISSKINSYSRNANLAISWGICLNHQNSLGDAKAALKIFSRSFIPIKFITSISKLYKNLFSVIPKSIVKKTHSLRNYVSLANDLSSAASSSVGLISICDAVSFKRLANNRSLSSKVGSFGSVTSLVSSISSLILSYIGYMENVEAFNGSSSRRRNLLFIQRSLARCNILTNLCTFSSSLVSFVSRYAFFPYSSLLATSLQTIPFMISVRNNLKLS